jgi:opacity protein-like surface antigen
LAAAHGTGLRTACRNAPGIAQVFRSNAGMTWPRGAMGQTAPEAPSSFAATGTASPRLGHLQFSKRGPARTGAPELTSLLPARRLRTREVQDRMKKIAIIAIVLSVCAAAGRAQESRQDVSISGTSMLEPWIASSTNVQVHSTVGFGVLASYRFMLTPSSAVEANYGMTYQNKIHYYVNPNNYIVQTRTQEVSFAYVRSFTYRKLNPFVEAGPAVLVFLPIFNSGTTSLDVKQQITIGGMYGAGIAYELSPSFDIRAEYRGLVSRVPTFSNTQFTTNKWYNIYNPTIGVAYHF